MSGNIVLMDVYWKHRGNPGAVVIRRPLLSAGPKLLIIGESIRVGGGAIELIFNGIQDYKLWRKGLSIGACQIGAIVPDLKLLCRSLKRRITGRRASEYFCLWCQIQ